jgi:hypothetical protein
MKLTIEVQVRDGIDNPQALPTALDEVAEFLERESHRALEGSGEARRLMDEAGKLIGRW